MPLESDHPTNSPNTDNPHEGNCTGACSHFTVDEILKKHILVDLRHMNTDPQYNEATMELTGLKSAINNLRVSDLKRLQESLPKTQLLVNSSVSEATGYNQALTEANELISRAIEELNK